jgi:hypothetical protein
LPWVVDFPRGYWLYEKSKHLWVSGYPIKSKLFKTPQEFGVHLLWLISPSKDYKDCCCIHCNVGERERIAQELAAMTISKEVGKTDASVAAGPLTQVVPAKTTAPTTAPTAAPVKATRARKTQSQEVPASTEAPAAKPATNTVAAPAAPPPVSASSVLFRTGELVWYKNGSNWRLGLISGTAQGNHEILPIGHGMILQPRVVKQGPDMRQFHAFSVPAVNIPDLTGQTFDYIKWESLLQTYAGNDPQKREFLALDASKLAALKIEFSYSLFNQVGPTGDGNNIGYSGIFLGAERVEVGDALRIRDSPQEVQLQPPVDSNVFVLRDILVSHGTLEALVFRGTVCRLTYGGDGITTNAVPDTNLPVALREETAWRNQVQPQGLWRWELVKDNVELKEQTVRGRFYPTHHLMPILDPPKFAAIVSRTVPLEQSYTYLNNRLDAQAGRYIGHKRNRIDTIGAAIPHGSRLALEDSVREDI